VQDEMARRGWTNAELAREAAVDAGTIGDFLGGSRWPKGVTRAKLATAFGWTPESLDIVERGGEPVPIETVGTPTQDAGVLLDMPPEALEGLGPAEREEVITAAKLSALAKAREIRRRLDE
jgi:transcriptional regulator with XRE-family HTH domain